MASRPRASRTPPRNPTNVALERIGPPSEENLIERAIVGVRRRELYKEHPRQLQDQLRSLDARAKAHGRSLAQRDELLREYAELRSQKIRGGTPKSRHVTARIGTTVEELAGEHKRQDYEPLGGSP